MDITGLDALRLHGTRCRSWSEAFQHFTQHAVPHFLQIVQDGRPGPIVQCDDLRDFGDLWEEHKCEREGSGGRRFHLTLRQVCP